MSEILIAYHLRKTWTAERFKSLMRAGQLWTESASQVAAQPAPAINDVCFSVQAGEIFGLVGPSGSGKSTLLGLLSGHITPDAGRVEVLGQELTGLDFEHRKMSGHMAMISQMTSSQVFNRLGAVENLVYCARLNGLNSGDAPELEKQARTLLADLGLNHAEMESPLNDAHYSILQKVAIGRALLARPRILLLDDITYGLDLHSRSGVLSVLRDYRRVYGITMILATRSLRTAAQVCDRITFLAQGKVTHLIMADDSALPAPHRAFETEADASQPCVQLSACEMQTV